MSDARVSVIIPAHHRPCALRRAVDSALGQTHDIHEVVVVVDGSDDQVVDVLTGVRDPRVRWHVVPEPQGAAAARNLGVRLAEGDVVAFLDDDDIWLPEKVSAQMKVWTAAEDADRLVVATAALWRTDAGEVVWPRRPIGPRERVADYLFCRREPGEGMLATPTLLVPRALALSIPLPTHRRLHEDWDWLLTLDAAGARFTVLPQPHVIVDGAGGRASLSSTGNWRASLSWALSRVDDLGPQAFSAFLLTEVGRAVDRQGGSVIAGAAVVLLALTGRPRGRDLLLFVARGVLSGRAQVRLQRVRHRARRA